MHLPGWCTHNMHTNGKPLQLIISKNIIYLVPSQPDILCNCNIISMYKYNVCCMVSIFNGWPEKPVDAMLCVRTNYHITVTSRHILKFLMNSNSKNVT